MKDIKKYEQMAKFDLTDAERKEVFKAYGVLIDSFDALQNTNTDGIEPMVTVLDVRNVMREDIAVKNISKKSLLSNAPAENGGFFEIPKIL